MVAVNYSSPGALPYGQIRPGVGYPTLNPALTAVISPTTALPPATIYNQQQFATANPFQSQSTRPQQFGNFAPQPSQPVFCLFLNKNQSWFYFYFYPLEVGNTWQKDLNKINIDLENFGISGNKTKTPGPPMSQMQSQGDNLCKGQIILLINSYITF